MKLSALRTIVIATFILACLTAYFSTDRKVSADPAPVACSNLTLSMIGDAPFATSSGSQGLAVGDLDNNGRSDVVTANPEGTVSILFQNLDGSFTIGPNLSVGPLGGYADAVVIDDFDGDGKKNDLAVAVAASSDRVAIFLNNGSGTLTLSGSFPVGQIPVALVAGDFNGDGIRDLATANRDSDDISILIGNGPASLRSHLLQWSWPQDQSR